MWICILVRPEVRYRRHSLLPLLHWRRGPGRGGLLQASVNLSLFKQTIEAEDFKSRQTHKCITVLIHIITPVKGRKGEKPLSSYPAATSHHIPIVKNASLAWR